MERQIRLSGTNIRRGIVKSLLVGGLTFVASSALAQSVIKGTVRDENGEGLPGVTVYLKGHPQNQGAISDIDGNFTISAAPGQVLEFRYIGFDDKEVAIKNGGNLSVSLVPNDRSLNEVVVIGYGTATKKEITGSVASISKDAMNTGTFTNAMGLLQGKVAGLSIVNPNGADPTAKYEVLLRGTNTLSAGQGPLVIIDDYLTNNIGAGTGLTDGKASMYSYKEDHTYVGFFGRAMYNYDEKYMLSLSLRRDGSSRFGKDNKWGWFPAVSAGWRISKEKFMENVKWLNDLNFAYTPVFDEAKYFNANGGRGTYDGAEQWKLHTYGDKPNVAGVHCIYSEKCGAGRRP